MKTLDLLSNANMPVLTKHIESGIVETKKLMNELEKQINTPIAIPF